MNNLESVKLLDKRIHIDMFYVNGSAALNTEYKRNIPPGSILLYSIASYLNAAPDAKSVWDVTHDGGTLIVKKVVDRQLSATVYICCIYS